MLSAADFTTIAIERLDDGVAVLRLDGPDRRNAVTDAMHSELSRIFAAAEDDPAVRAVVLTGAGTTFSSGGDTSPERPYETTSGRSPIDEARHIVDDVIALRKPLVAAVNGHAIGLGATLATLADVSYMEESARIGDPHVLAALPAGNGSAVIWPLLIGVNRAKLLLMTGELMSAADAAACGLVTKVVGDGTSLDEAVGLATRLARLAPQAVQGTKASINRVLAMVSTLVLPYSLALEETAMQHPDFRAALDRLSS